MSNYTRFIVGFTLFAGSACWMQQAPIPAIFISFVAFCIVVPVGFPGRKYD